MASEGPLSPGTTANVSPGPGNDALTFWGSTANITSSNNTYARTDNTSGSNHIDLGAKLIKGGTISGSNLAVGTAIPNGSGAETYLSYGSSTNLWGLSLSDTDVNASTFGFAFAVRSTGGSGSEWLTATNFGFAIPSGATIDGVVAEVECYHDAGVYSYVDHVRITVYYTAGGGGGTVSQLCLLGVG